MLRLVMVTQTRLLDLNPCRPLAAEIDVLVIEEEIAIEPANLIEAPPVEEQTAAGHPRHSRTTTGSNAIILAPFARQTKPQQCIQ